MDHANVRRKTGLWRPSPRHAKEKEGVAGFRSPSSLSWNVPGEDATPRARKTTVRMPKGLAATRFLLKRRPARPARMGAAARRRGIRRTRFAGAGCSLLR